MSRRKKIILWVIGVIGILLVLLLILILLLPRLVNLEPLREKMLASILQKIGGKLEFQRVDLSFFPRPGKSREGQVLESPGANLRFIKKPLGKAKRGLGTSLI